MSSASLTDDSTPPTPKTIIAKAADPSSDRILFAVPKKGRLYERVLSLLAGAGLDFMRMNRLDIAPCHKLPVTIVFLPAADIASYVGEGNVDLGITGQDIVAESGSHVDTLMNLHMGKCRLCLQAPKSTGVPATAESLAGKRIVTSFPNLARQFFAPYDKAAGVTTTIKYVSGSVEAACNLGLADGIVDLVETGTTMDAAGLEAVADVMVSQTVLIANPKRLQSAPHRRLVEIVHQRLQGYITAQQNCMLSYNVRRTQLPLATQITPGHDSPTVMPLDDPAWVSVSALVKRADVGDIMDRLKALGATGILQIDFSNCRF